MTMLATDDPFSGQEISLAPAERIGFGEAFGDAWRQTRLLNQSNSGAIVQREALDDLANQVGDNSGTIGGVRLRGPALPTNTMQERTERLPLLLDKVRTARKTDPHAYPGLPATPEDFDGWLSARVKREAGDLDAALARPGTGGTVGTFLGSMAAAVTDPVNLALMPFGAARAAGVLRTALTEAALGAGSVVVSAPMVADWRGKVGLEYTAGEFFDNLAYSAGGSGAVAGGLQVVGKTAKVLGVIRDLHGKKLVDAADNLEVKSKEVRAARDILASVQETLDTNPLGDHPIGLEEHQQRFAEAVEAIAGNRAPSMPDEPLMPSQAPSEGLPMPAGRGSFKPSEVHVDADRFQFKSGGDQEGVLPTLRHVQEWNPVLSGDLMFWEDKGGKVFVADGHQRSGLARRMEAAGDQGIRLEGPVFREADGVTADDVRVYAALKNIIQGDPNAVDAAKIVRTAPALFDHPAIPRSRELVRTARALASLSDEAFGMAINEVVPATHAALVGRLAPDPETHVPLLRLLAKTEPANITQAESIVRQGLEAGGTREVQDSLFGAQESVHLLFAERAKVLDATLKALRRDKAVFSTLTDEADRIAAAGNQLAEGENVARAQRADAALAVLIKLAHRKGPLADALNKAAEKARTEGVAGAARDFARAVADAIEGGALRGLDAEPTGSGGHVAEKTRGGDGGPQTSGQARLETFSDPGAGGAREQANQLAIEAREDLERAPGQGDEIPTDPLTGDAVSTQDMFGEFQKDDEAIAHLKGCIAGGQA